MKHIATNAIVLCDVRDLSHVHESVAQGLEAALIDTESSLHVTSGFDVTISVIRPLAICCLCPQHY